MTTIISHGQNNETGEYEYRLADGTTLSAASLVVVERMPDHLRASHRAARNWGTYPANGAERVVMDRDDAESLVSDDADEYDRIIRDATAADVTNYGYVTL